MALVIRCPGCGHPNPPGLETSRKGCERCEEDLFGISPTESDPAPEVAVAASRCPAPDCGVENGSGRAFCIRCDTPIPAPLRSATPASIGSPDVGVLVWEGGTETVVERHLALGREATYSPVADRLLGHPDISRFHAEIRFEDGRYHLVDVGSRHGTWLDARRIAPHVREPLTDGALIVLADVVTLRFGVRPRAS